MPFCPECGKSVGSSQKFCRSCGASLIEESPAAAAPPAPPAGMNCRSCGAPLAPDEKFCGICGTRAGNAGTAPVPAAPAAPAPAPAPAPAYQAPPPPPPAYQPPPPPPQYTAPAPVAAPVPVAAPAPAPGPAGRVCKACGNPIKPGDKYCSKCLVKVPDSPAPVPAANAVSAPAQAPAPAYQPPPPPPPQYTAPPPVAAPVPVAAPAPAPGPAGRVCKACGNPINPGDKYCSKCLVKVPDSPAPAPAAYAAPAPAPAYQAPPPPAAAAAAGGNVCASCGSPASGSEKFCGICGSPMVASRPAAPAPAPAPAPAGKFCGTCGAPIAETTKFCGSCGAAVNTAPSGGGDSSFRPVPPVAGGEEIIGVIANARKVKFLGASWDTWNIVITSRRMIMVQMTSAMINAAVAEAQAKAKAEGKGFFGIMKDQLAAQFRYAVRYETMNPDAALAETPGNISVENARISAINVKLRDTGSGDMEYTEFKISIVSSDGTFEYMMAEDDRYINLVKQVYGDRVHMPFGYFKVSGARIKLF